jgi:cytochrome c
MRLRILCALCGLLALGGARAEDAIALLERYRCSICHAPFETKAGPSYADVAQRHRNDPQALAAVSDVVIKGARGRGLWHMPPHPEISPAEARTIARYILDLTPDRAPDVEHSRRTP